MCSGRESKETIEKLLPLSDTSVQNGAGHQPPLNRAETQREAKEKQHSAQPRALSGGCTFLLDWALRYIPAQVMADTPTKLTTPLALF